MKLFVDGQLKSEDKDPSESWYTTPLVFGEQISIGKRDWGGNIGTPVDELRIYDRALTQKDIQLIIQRPEGL